MQSIQLQNDTLIDIATFLVRRWSGKENVTVEFSKIRQNETRLKEKRVSLIPNEQHYGNDFQKYRQFRASIWYEAMRLKHCQKILSSDHAYGFILNAIETRRIELVGIKVWGGMVDELIFNYTNMWISRTNLGSIFGKARTVEAFYQYFLFGDIKGEMQPNQFNKVTKAVEFAKRVLNEAIEKDHNTTWLESKIPEILKILDLDALDFSKFDPENVLAGKTVLDEFKVIKTENKKNEKKGLNTKSIGIEIPDQSNVDETKIYDQDLINNLKAKFKEWKTGWKEYHFFVGDEFDNDAYLEGSDKPFVIDLKKSIKTRIVILLDHSSSIADQQLDYKKATLALCEVLAFLKIKFSVYAFNTTGRQVMCWLIKPDDLKWTNGGTPLAEVYNKLYPILHSKKPDIFLTLSDGEPSDTFAAHHMVKLFKSVGIKMVAIGVGRDTRNATIIATNLKYLGFERTLGVSRLKDIPNKVLNVLSDA
ncbi:MAG: hypothetical protein CXT79_04245 [Thaumarchaeota archaeon]|nr:MAG: hypothetical protein CXT79_04245 [Nitrososphaerota archaeon]